MKLKPLLKILLALKSHQKPTWVAAGGYLKKVCPVTGYFKSGQRTINDFNSNATSKVPCFLKLTPDVSSGKVW